MTLKRKLLIVSLAVVTTAGGFGLYQRLEPGLSHQAAEPPADVARPELAQAAAVEADPAAVVPTFDVVLVEPDGELLAAGRAAAGALVDLLLNGEPLASEEANRDGEWMMQPGDPVPPGRHELRLLATGEDGLGGPVDGDRLTIEVSARDEAPLATASVPGRAGESAGSVVVPGGPGQGLSVSSDAFDVEGPDHLRAGGQDELGPRVKADPPLGEVSAGGAARRPEQVAIERGDTLWEIAHAIFGRGDLYVLIYQANRGQIDDPSLIYPGQVFTMPVDGPPVE